MEQFSYTRGKSKYIDFLCDSNKLVLLSDTKIIAQKLKPLYEDILQFPAKDVLVLFPGLNISSIGLKKLIERIDNESAVPVNDVRLDDLSSAAFLVDKGQVIYDCPAMILPWQRLIELLDDIDIVALMDPLQTK